MTRSAPRLARQATRAARQPVTTSQLPLVTCAACQRPVPHRRGPGLAAAALTEHYQARHPELRAVP